MEEEAYLVDISPEELKNLGKILADTLIQQSTTVISIEVIEIEEIETISLDLIASATAGITDPFGQLRDWISGILNTVASGITSAINTFINRYVLPAIDAVTSGIKNFINTYVIPAINTVTSGVSDFINRYVLPAISGVISSITSFIGEKVLPAVSGVISTIVGFIGERVLPAIGNVISSIASFIGDKVIPAISGVISTVVGFIGEKVLPAIGGAISSIIGFIGEKVLPAIGNAISSIVGFIGNKVLPAIGGVISSIVGFIGEKVVPAIAGVISTIVGFIGEKVIPAIGGAITSIIGFIGEKLIPTVTGLFSSIISFIGERVLPAIAGAISTIVGFIGEKVIPVITGIISGIIGFIGERVIPVITTAFSGVSDFISKNVLPALTNIGASIGAGFAVLGNTVMGFINAILRFPEWFPNWFKEKIADPIAKALSDIAKAIWDMLPDVVKNALTAIYNFFTKDVLNFFTKTLPDFFEWLRKGFEDFLKDPLGWINKNIIEPLVGGLKAIGEWIWNALPDFIKNALTAIYNFFTKDLVDFFTKTLPNFVDTLIKGVQDFIKDPLGWISKHLVEPFMDGLKAIGEWIWKALPDVVKDSLTAIKNFFTKDVVDFFTKTLPDFFKTIIDKLKEFFADPVKWLQENVLPAFSVKITHSPPIIVFPATGMETTWSFPILPIIEPFVKPKEWFEKTLVPALEGIRDAIWGGITTIAKWIGDSLQTLWSTLVDGFNALGKFLVDSISGLVKGAWNTVTGLVEGFKEFIKNIYDGANKALGDLIKGTVSSTFKDIFKELKIGTPEELKISKIEASLALMTTFTFDLMTSPLWGQFIARVISWNVKGFAMAIGKAVKDMEINLAPLGIGMKIAFNLAEAFGSALYTFAEEIVKYMEEMGRGIIYGLAIWVTRPFTSVLNYHVRNFLVVRMPRDDIIIEFCRRTMKYNITRSATGEITDVKAIDIYKDTLDLSKFYLALYGYSDEVLRWFFSFEPNDWVHVKDRFNYTRNFPLSLVHTLPSASEVARMMVRDMFYSFEDFKTAIGLRGMPEDVAYMYYLQHFRYPPPERLWQFTTRGISGLLWATITPDEAKWIESEVSTVKAFSPVPPVELNFDAPRLFNAFKTYMKWHDYGRFAWINNFTSDNLIYTDTLADIPTKIDQRWMARFGLYELLTAKGVGATSPVSEFRTKIMEDSAKSPVKMDLVNFCRTLQATGLHPDWVPITAVAETINAITDERTMLRSGVLGAFKEGFIDLETIEGILKGAIITSFKVYVFDSEKMSWKDGWINIPLMFLPPERKLTELRALFDRSMDILKEIQRDISVAYQENIIADYNEYKETLTKVIDSVNKFFTKEFKNISGTELALEFVEDYYAPYVDALKIYRDVHIVRRIRSWTMRWLGWLMYRIATGVTSKKEYSDLVDIVKEYSKLTDKEEEFLKKVTETMYGIAVKEYVPTPSQLATLSEYIVISQEIINKTFEARMMPEEWRGIWKQYIDVRPIADDVKGLITTYRRALVYTTIPEAIANKVKEYAKLINFTDREFDILGLRVSLEELILQSREYIPTLSQLATICEYVPEARQYFDEVVKARRVPQEWIPVWSKYIDYRPLIDEVKKMISRAEDLYVYFTTTEEDYKKVLDSVKYLGWTDKEIEFMLYTSRLERFLRAWRELVGDVDRMTMLAEYSPRARDFALGQLYKMIDAMPIDDATKKALKEMWEQFIRLKPVKDEVTKYVTDLINLYVDGLISDADFDKELNSLRQWGLDDYEVMFYKAIAGARRARKLRIPVVYPS